MLQMSRLFLRPAPGGPTGKTEGRRRKAGSGRQKAEGGRQEAEGRTQKAERRRQKAGIGRRKAEGSGLPSKKMMGQLEFPACDRRAAPVHSPRQGKGTGQSGGGLVCALSAPAGPPGLRAGCQGKGIDSAET